eukprot:2517393-Ditylum_brightwellii.AAC.1
MEEVSREKLETALPSLMDKRREFNRSKVTRTIDDQVTDRNWVDTLDVDTGGGRNSTVTKRHGMFLKTQIKNNL